MADENVSVRFGAETSAVKTGGDEVKGVLASIGAGVKGLVDAFLVLGGAATGSFREIRAGAAEAGTQIKETAEGVKEFREAVAGFGEALIAAFAIEQISEFAKKMAETAEQVQHTAQTFGLATSEVQQLKAEAALLGVPFEAFLTAMQRSDRALTTARQGSKQAAEAFKTLGINIHDPISQTKLMHEELSGLANVQDVPTRIGLAMQLFGRNIQNIAPMIGVTSDQLKEFDQTISAYGAVNDDAQAKGLALAESFNTNTVAMQGLGNTLTQALAPAFTQIVDGLNQMIKGFIDSYNQGGAAKVVLDLLVISLKFLAGAAALFGSAIVVAIDLGKASVDSFSAVWKTVSDFFVNTAKQMLDEAVTLGKVIYDSLTGNVLQAAQDMKAGWATMEVDAKKTADDMAADFAKAAKAASASVNEAMAAAKGAGAFLGSLVMPPAPTPTPPKTGTGNGGAPPNLNTKTGGGDKSQMEAFRTALAELEDKSRADTGQWLADLSDMDLAYWQGVLKNATLSVKDRETVERQIADLTKKINGEAQQEVLAQDRAKISADKGNVEALKSDWQKYVDDTVAAYGSGSRQVIDVSRQMGAAIRDATQKNADDLARIIQHEVDQEVEAHKQGLEKEKQAYQQFKSVIGPVVSSFTSGLVQMAEGAQTFAQSMRNLGQQILNDFVSKVIDPMIEKWLWSGVQKVLSTNVTNAAVTASNQASAEANLLIAMETNLKKIAMDAKTAAAGAYNWAAAWGGPIAGAIAAAVAFAGVMAFGSFSKGVDVVPNDMIAQVHAGERIMPAADNSAMISALRSLGSLTVAMPRLSAPQMPSFSSAPGAAGPWGGVTIGDTHIHTSSGAPDIRAALREHRSELLKQIGEGVRGGWTSPHANPFRGG